MKRVLSFLLCIVMMMYFMPTMAFSQTGVATTNNTAKSINIGADAITVPKGGWDKTDGNYLYYGAYDNKATKYRVLSNSKGTMLIDSDKALYAAAFDQNKIIGATYNTSSVREEIKSGGKFFGSKEIENIKETKLTAKESYSVKNDICYGTGYQFCDDSSEENKSFLLSAEEIETYYKDSDAAKKSGATQWWVRSAIQSSSGNIAGTMLYVGKFWDMTAANAFSVGVVPASYLSTENILFTTEKTFDKEITIAKVEGAVSKEWKVTLKDTTKSVAAENVTLNGEKVSVPITLTGSDIDQVSVVITDKDIDSSESTILYYGKLNDIDVAETTEQQTGTFTLPSELADGYKIYLVAEDINTDADAGSITDYASEPVEISFSIIGGTFSVDPTAKLSEGYIAKRTGDAGNYTYKVLAKTNLTSGVYMSDPKGALASGYYVSSSNGDEGSWTVSYAGGGSYTPVTPVTPKTDEVTNKTEDNGSGTTINVTEKVVESKTTTAADGTKTVAAEVSTADAEKIVENAVSGKSDKVVIDTANAAAVTETAAGTTTKVDLPEQTVKAIAEQTEAAVTIKTEAAEVTLDKDAVKAVAEQAGDAGTVNLVVETVKQDESAVQVDLKLVTSKGTVSDFKGGNVSVTVKLNDKLAAKAVVCVYIDDNSKYHRVDGVKNDNGTFTFRTGHFSSYAIMAADDADKVIADQLDTLIKEVSLKVKTTRTSKKNIRVTVSGDVSALTDAGYTVKYRFCRSTKASGSYVGKKTKTSASWINTAGTKGTKYYYKAKVYVYDEKGTKVGQTTLSQSKYSTRTWSK